MRRLYLVVGVVAFIGCGDSEDGGGSEGASEASADSTGGSSAESSSSGETGDADSGPSTSNGDTTSTSDGTGAETDASTGTTGEMETEGADDTQGDTGPQNCQAPENHVACDDDDDPFHAIGLNCPGNANDSTPISNEVFVAPDASSYRIAKQYGTYIDPNTNEPFWGPTEGESFLFISTGKIDPPDQNGVITKPPGGFQPGDGNNNPDGQPLPAPMSHLMGSNNGAGGNPFNDCDGVNDCSDTLFDQWELGGGAANDLLFFRFDLEVPMGTTGFEMDFAWFSAEYPEYVNTFWNDIFVVWSTSEAYTGNITFIDNQPLTVTAMANAVHDSGLWGDAPELVGTGFDGFEGQSCFPMDPFNDPDCPVGGGTGWYTAKGAAEPGETFTLAFAIFDMSDGILDTAAIIDNWRWDCMGCVPNEVEGCEIEPQ